MCVPLFCGIFRLCLEAGPIKRSLFCSGGTKGGLVERHLGAPRGRGAPAGTEPTSQATQCGGRGACGSGDSAPCSEMGKEEEGQRRGKGEGALTRAGLRRGLPAPVARKGADAEPARKGLYSGVRLTTSTVERTPPR